MHLSLTQYDWTVHTYSKAPCITPPKEGICTNRNSLSYDRPKLFLFEIRKEHLADAM